MNLLTLSVVLFLLGLFLLWRVRVGRKGVGLPGGRIIYSDMNQWDEVRSAFYDPDNHLTGRPDYIVQQGEQIIPVEVKTSPNPSSPFDSHIYQLAAYCLLVQRSMGERPDYGILHYPNRTYAIDYTPQLELRLLALLDEMRSQDKRKEVARSHDSPARCRECGFQSLCDQSIA